MSLIYLQKGSVRMKTVLAFQDIARLTDITLQHHHYMDKIKIIITWLPSSLWWQLYIWPAQDWLPLILGNHFRHWPIINCLLEIFIMIIILKRDHDHYDSNYDHLDDDQVDPVMEGRNGKHRTLSSGAAIQILGGNVHYVSQVKKISTCYSSP